MELNFKKYDVLFIANTSSMNLTHKEYMELTHTIREVYRSLGYTVRKGIIYKKGKRKSDFFIFPLSINSLSDSAEMSDKELTVAFVKFYFQSEKNKSVLFKKLIIDDSTVNTDLIKFGLNQITDNDIKKLTKRLLDDSKFNFTSIELFILLSKFYDVFFECLPREVNPNIIGWVKSNNNVRFVPVHNQARNGENEAISWYLEDFDFNSTEHLAEILKLGFSSTDIVLLGYSFLSLSKYFYNDPNKQPKYFIYIKSNNTANAFRVVSFWTNLFCRNYMRAFSNSLNKTFKIGFSNIKKIALNLMSLRNVNVIIFNEPNPQYGLKTKVKKKLLNSSELSILALNGIIPIVIEPEAYSFMPPNDKGLVFELVNSCINTSDLCSDETDYLKIDLMNVYKGFIDFLMKEANEKRLNVYTYLNKAFNFLKEGQYATESSVENHAYLLASIYLFCDSIQHNIPQENKCDLKHFVKKAEQTFIGLLGSKATILQVATEEEYIRLFCNFIGYLINEKQIVAIGGMGDERTVGWLDLAQGEKIIYLKYNGYYIQFNSFAASKGVKLPNWQHRFEKDILGKNNILYLQFDPKGSYKRYDIKKVIVSNQPKIKTIKVNIKTLAALNDDHYINDFTHRF